MSKIFIAAGLALALVACSKKENNTENNTTDAKTLYQESMKIHDEVMPRMDEIYKLEGRLKSLKDSLLTDSITNSQKIALVREKLAALEAANNDMMDWMHNIQDVPGAAAQPGQEHHMEHMEHHDHAAAPEANPEDILKIQQEQKARIESVEQEMENSIQQAKELLKK